MTQTFLTIVTLLVSAKSFAYDSQNCAIYVGVNSQSAYFGGLTKLQVKSLRRFLKTEKIQEEKINYRASHFVDSREVGVLNGQNYQGFRILTVSKRTGLVDSKEIFWGSNIEEVKTFLNDLCG